MRRLAIILGALLCVSTVVIAAELLMQVAVRQASVRAKPKPLAKIVQRLKSGDTVTVLKKDDEWAHVKLADGKEGYLRMSSLTDEATSLKAGAGGKTGATDEEMALAGKGFSKEVEKEYRRQNTALDYAWIDRVEGYNYSDKQRAAFRQAGGLKGGDQ